MKPFFPPATSKLVRVRPPPDGGSRLSQRMTHALHAGMMQAVLAPPFTARPLVENGMMQHDNSHRTAALALQTGALRLVFSNK